MVHGALTLSLVMSVALGGCRDGSSDAPSAGSAQPAADAAAPGANAPWEEPLPAAAEWAKAPVAMSKTGGVIQCEVKTVSRWARLGCRTSDPAKPPVFSLKKGNSADVFDASGEVGVHYLLVDGQHVVAEITSGTDWVKFGYEWPPNSLEPPTPGVF